MDAYHDLLLPIYLAMADAVKKKSLIHTDEETAFGTTGMGYGFRLNLGIFVLRYTRAHTVDGVGIGTDEFRSYWSLGADF